MTDSRKYSLLFAATLVVAVVVWFWSGSDSAEAPVAEPRADEPAPSASVPMMVAARLIEAELITREARLQGYTAPNRQVTIRAETAGRVDTLLVARGARVQAGQAVVQLALDDRPAERRKAAALLVQRENDYAAIAELATQGHLPKTRVDEAFADLEAARAELAAVERDIERTTLRAPFEGILNERDIELGDYVAVRDPVFKIVDHDPLLVIAEVSQRDYSAIGVESESTVRLVTGEQVPGRVRYLSTIADEATRTFRVEIELDNPDGALPGGVSAEASIPTRQTNAHRISPGWLVRTTQGEVGVYLAEAGVAEFLPVAIVRSTADSVWVTGLPRAARVVTSGQGFLEPGRPVELAAPSRLSEGATRERDERIARAQGVSR